MLYVVVRRCFLSPVSVVVLHLDIAGNDQRSQNVGEGEGTEKGGSVVLTFCSLFSLFFLHVVFLWRFPNYFSRWRKHESRWRYQHQRWKLRDLRSSKRSGKAARYFQSLTTIALYCRSQTVIYLCVFLFSKSFDYKIYFRFGTFVLVICFFLFPCIIARAPKSEGMKKMRNIE